MTRNFSIIEANELSEWDRFVDSSPEGTPFVSSLFLDAMGVPYQNFYVLKGTTTRAGVSLILSDSGKETIPFYPVIYNGLIFVPPPPEQNFARMVSDQFEIAEFVFTELPKIYRNVFMTLSPLIKDLRSALWVNYNRPTDGQYRLELRYTSFVDLKLMSGDVDESPLFSLLGQSRRQEIRYARKEGVKAKINGNPTDLIRLYREAQIKKGREPIAAELSRMEKTMKTMDKINRGALVSVIGDDIESAAYFIWDRKRAYYLYGANNTNNKRNFSGTIALWDGLHFLRDLGVDSVDLEGVNSPNRGWFKLSLGGNLLPYFRISFEGNK